MKRQNNVLTYLLREVNLLVHEVESLHCELKELKKWCQSRENDCQVDAAFLTSASSQVLATVGSTKLVPSTDILCFD